MNSKIRDFYWNTNKNFVLDVLSYEFEGEFEIEDSSWKNDECPSLLLNQGTIILQLFLPSNYMGEYSDFCLMVYNTYSDFMDDNSDTYFFFTNLNEVIEKLKTYL
jgi:hypothetical protein